MTNVVGMGHRRRPAWSWADRVRKVRRDLGLTQAGFAELTGIGEKTIAAWESGKNTPDIASVSVILETATDVDRLWWIGWTEPEPSPPTVGPAAPANSGYRSRRKITNLRAGLSTGLANVA